MATLSRLIAAVPAFAGVVLAANYPAEPSDLTTPVQQRIAIHGPDGKCEQRGVNNYLGQCSHSLTDD